ncbi:hypothetical protein RRG08_025093 [Elysia crispata]|uniref:Uncharacterized protein n=1 Tax=Elysia crispata TaxID=231223 RepID=A0AAE1AJM6_9GAST|nr:hypothetical protein RRG08_025093 [Elysia crispata]
MLRFRELNAKPKSSNRRPLSRTPYRHVTSARGLVLRPGCVLSLASDQITIHWLIVAQLKTSLESMRPDVKLRQDGKSEHGLCVRDMNRAEQRRQPGGDRRGVDEADGDKED